MVGWWRKGISTELAPSGGVVVIVWLISPWILSQDQLSQRSQCLSWRPTSPSSSGGFKLTPRLVEVFRPYPESTSGNQPLFAICVSLGMYHCAPAPGWLNSLSLIYHCGKGVSGSHVRQ